MAKIYQSSIGIQLDFDTKIDPATLKTATALNIAVTNPDATTTSWSATVLTDTSRVRHTIGSGEIDQVGKYLLQPVIHFGSALVKGETVTIQIYAPFK